MIEDEGNNNNNIEGQKEEKKRRRKSSEGGEKAEEKIVKKHKVYTHLYPAKRNYEIKKELPEWMKNNLFIENNDPQSMDDFLQKCQLDPTIISNLKSLNITSVFPTQSVVIPEIMKRTVTAGDVCVCAPTGSGKTLAYVIPIIQSLMFRVVCRLRALVILPTRDLVIQVFNVFHQMLKNTPLKVVKLTGETPFAKEQRSLVGNNYKDVSAKHGGQSVVDIVISTPGRLMDHLKDTPGFTLQHLSFLVLDEVDRLLMQSYNEFLTKILQSINSMPHAQIIDDKLNGVFFI
jgi:ATP-dependent RNA helicase DDX51/DBP6